MAIFTEKASAQDSPTLEIWGFMDFQFSADDDWADGDHFILGQAEIDIESELSPYVSTAMALAFDPDAESFGPGVAVADFHMWGSDDGHRYQNKTIDASALPACRQRIAMAIVKIPRIIFPLSSFGH